MLKLYGKKNKKLTVDLSTVNELKENDKILIASNGKMKQIDQDLVNIGGGSTPSMPIVGDGKTRLYVTVASMDRPVISIYFGCTVVGGVTIDWGDGSATETTTSTERTRYSHSYSAAGDYVIALEVTDGELVLVGGMSDNGPQGITQAMDNAEGIPYTLSYNNSTLKMVEIGSGITSIGDYAFFSCYALTSVTIPSSVTSIGSNAFGNCYALTSVTIPSSVTSIGDGAFYNCSALTSVTIPSSVTSIGINAFGNCSALTSVTIPEGVTSIGESAFVACGLTSVTIPEGVTSIGESAFDYCSFLTSVVIPSSVTSIGDSAFSGCTALTSVTIPSSVTSIGNNAFISCSSLGGVHLLSLTPPTLPAGLFDSVPEDCKIYIPAGSLEAYSSASNWSKYTSYFVEE